MALHHRPEMENIRSAYYETKSNLSDQDSERRSNNTSRTGSDRSYQTAATEYSGSFAKRPVRVHNNTCDSRIPTLPRYFEDRQPQDSPRCSVETYASTIASDEGDEEEDIDVIPDYDVPAWTPQEQQGPNVIAATPADFSELFPSHRRLVIRHDDATLDGNMNLRVDTDVNIHGQRGDMTLFHLRMHDLRDREFSLRRYCRDSGREVCHSSRRIQKQQAPRRPGFHRSLSNALSNMRSKSEQRSPTLTSLKRNDSGYGSINCSNDFDRNARPGSASATPKHQQAIDRNLIKLEFSNYAQLDIRRSGSKGSKRYEFEYWGVTYSWKRTARNERNTRMVSYSLVKNGSDRALAHIKPTHLNREQVDEERRLGGWIPPCTFGIDDESIVRGQKDVAE